MESNDPESAKHLIFDYRLANLTPAQLAFCAYAVKLTLTPQVMEESDIQELRNVGYSDEQISLGVQVISYFNYINRVADGLQVDDELWMDISHEDWKQQKASYRIS